MTAAAFAVQLSLEPVTCGGCGAVFAINQDLHQRYRNEGLAIRCPNPRCDWQSMVIRETEVQRLKKQLAEETARAERANEAHRWARERAEAELNSHRATRGHLTRARKRAAAGLCPCCNRSFQNLRRHMKTKHQDFPAKVAS